MRLPWCWNLAGEFKISQFILDRTVVLAIFYMDGCLGGSMGGLVHKWVD